MKSNEIIELNKSKEENNFSNQEESYFHEKHKIKIMMEPII